MTPDLARLERECRTFTRLLANATATPYVVGKYADAHHVRPDLQAGMGFEGALVDMAASGPVVARLADAYARRTFPRGVLRKKLVLLLAILETSADVHRTIDTGPTRSMTVAVLSLAAHAVTGAAAAAVGLIAFGLMRAFWWSASRPS